MPILECRCGLITSLSATAERGRCPRCGCATPTHAWKITETATGGKGRVSSCLERVPLERSTFNQPSDHQDTTDVCQSRSSDPLQMRVESYVRSGDNDSSSLSKLMVAKARQVLDWLEQLSQHGEISTEAYEREVRRVLRTVVREVHRSIPN